MRGIAVALTLSIGLAGCASLSRLAHERAAEGSAARLPGAHAGNIGGWTIKVSVEPSGVSPIFISVGRPRGAPTNGARPWVQHELVFENRGGRLVRFADTRTSAFIPAIGRRRLLAADVGCGYAPETGTSRIEAGVCAAYLDAPAVKPHASISRTVTLFKGLRGMAPLTPGTYVFEKVIRFRVGHDLPAEGTGRTAVVRLVYEIERVSP